MCALYSANSLYSYFVPPSTEIMEHSSDLAGTAAPSLVMSFRRTVRGRGAESHSQGLGYMAASLSTFRFLL